MIDENLCRNMIENLRQDIKYQLISINLNNFEPKTKKSLEKILNNADKLIKLIDTVPTVPKMINTLFPVGSVYMTYIEGGAATPPFSFGTWNQIYSINVSNGTVIYWRRTA